MPYVSTAFFILIPLSMATMLCRNCSLLQFPFFFNFSLLLLNLVLYLFSPLRSLFVMSSKTCLTCDELRGRSPTIVSALKFLHEPLICCRREGGGVLAGGMGLSSCAPPHWRASTLLSVEVVLPFQ
jgi:hypothetical protein